MEYYSGAGTYKCGKVVQVTGLYKRNIIIGSEENKVLEKDNQDILRFLYFMLYLFIIYKYISYVN